MRLFYKKPKSWLWTFHVTDSLEKDVANGHIGRDWRFRLENESADTTLDAILKLERQHRGKPPHSGASQHCRKAADNNSSQAKASKPPAGVTTEALAHANVLGLHGKVTFTDIKRHYRERMLEYHPDRVASLGPKLRELAEVETKKINAAYEFFKAQNAADRNT